MANAYTDTSSSSLGTSLVQTAYDRYVEFALRAEPLFRTVADKRPAQQAMPGSSVVLQLYNDIAPTTSKLNETTDPDAVAIGNTSTVTITLDEYGNDVVTTRKVELFSLSDIDPAVANMVAWNMRDSLDVDAQEVLRAGTNVYRNASATWEYNTGAVSDVTGTDVFQTKAVRFSVAKLRTNKVQPRRNGKYQFFIHPEVSYDLRAESGAGGWQLPHVYSAPAEIWDGEIGEYEGGFFVESPRCYNATDGASSARVFRTYAVGMQAFAEAVAEEPHVVIGPITDKLARFRPVGWYGVLGWSVYRQAALIRIESTSSIDNA